MEVNYFFPCFQIPNFWQQPTNCLTSVFDHFVRLALKGLKVIVLRLIVTDIPRFLEAFIKRVKSSYRRCSVKKAVLKNFSIFTGKQLCWSLFLMKLQAWRLHRCFPVNIVKFFRTLILKNICERLLLVNFSLENTDLFRVFTASKECFKSLSGSNLTFFKRTPHPQKRENRTFLLNMNICNERKPESIVETDSIWRGTEYLSVLSPNAV